MGIQRKACALLYAKLGTVFSLARICAQNLAKPNLGMPRPKFTRGNNDGISLGANDLGALRNLRWPPPPFIFSDFSPFTDVQNPGITMILLKTLEL